MLKPASRNTTWLLPGAAGPRLAPPTRERTQEFIEGNLLLSIADKLGLGLEPLRR